MRSRVATIGLVMALGCGGTVRRTSGDPGAGGTSAASSGGSGGSTSPVAGSDSGGFGGDIQDGGSRLLTPEEKEQIYKDACLGVRVESELIPASLGWVVALDSTMSTPAPGAAGDSRWAVTRQNIEMAHELLPEATMVGALLFPNLGPMGAAASQSPQDIGACVNVGAQVTSDLLGKLGSAHRIQLSNALESATLGPGRPLEDAYLNAVVTAPGTLPYIVLITDGPPTLTRGCVNPVGPNNPVDATELERAVTSAFSMNGIRTYVIGLPGSESVRDMLSRLADYGGTSRACADGSSCHFDLSQSQDLPLELDAVMREIVADIEALQQPLFPCEYTVPPAPSGYKLDLTKISVIVGDRLILRDNFGECSEGWRFKTDDLIELCPVSCAEAQTNGTGIEILYGCLPPPPDL